MGIVDWAVLLAFLAWVVWDGLRRSRGTRDLEGYFAGGRSIPWWAAGLSVMATQASAITVIGTTGQGHDEGMDFVQSYFGLPFAMILLCIFMVPLFRKAPILTAYEYLEGRFGPATRTLASLIFLLSRCLAIGVVIYAPAIVLSALLHVPPSGTVVFIGALTTLYTMAGGVNAVIWTDVKQMSVILGGLFLCLGILLWHLLQHVGFGELLEFTGGAGKLNPVELQPASTDFVPRTAWSGDDAPKSFWEEKYNFWSGLLGGLFLMLAYFGTDQSQVQRILTNPSVRESRLALLVSAFAKIPMQVLVLFLGVLLWAHGTLDQGEDGRPVAELIYDPVLAQSFAEAEQESEEAAGIRAQFRSAVHQRRELALRVARERGDGHDDGAGSLLAAYQESVQEVTRVRERGRLLAAREKARSEGAAEAELPAEAPTDTNYIFPRFILDHLPPVLLGLMIAAIFAAAMSSIDSALNSVTSSAVVDIYRRWLRPESTPAQSLLASRVFTLILGTVSTVAAVHFEGAGSVIELVNRVGSYFYGSLLGVFVLALFLPRARARAGFCGLVGGMALVLLVHFTLYVEFLWYNVIGCLGVLVVGGIASLTERR